jgi:hypothetical protein
MQIRVMDRDGAIHEPRRRVKQIGRSSYMLSFYVSIPGPAFGNKEAARR